MGRVEEQYERLVHELTLLNLEGHLHEGMQFAAAHHTDVVMRLSTLWVAVSLATQSILGCLPIDVSQVGVVGEMVARF
jgi:hypothetical protein